MNLLSLFLGGTGIFVVFTKFNVPELNMSFFGENPFAIKRDTINFVMTWIFTLLALGGIFIQVILQIMGEQVPERLHGLMHYVYFSGSLLVAMTVLVIGLSTFGNWYARRTWLPEVVSKTKESYMQAEIIIANDGWRQDQLVVKDTLQDKERYRKANFDNTEKHITQIERLFELPESTTNLESRIDRLKPYFVNE